MYVAGKMFAGAREGVRGSRGLGVGNMERGVWVVGDDRGVRHGAGALCCFGRKYVEHTVATCFHFLV